MPCVFCSIVSRRLTSVDVYEESDFMVIMDKYPINVGHTLIITKRHYDNLLSMSPADVGKLYSLVPRLAKAIISAVKADGFNVGQNNGRAANQIVPHVHVHIIPRFNEQTENEKWPTRRVASYTELQIVAKKIKMLLLPHLNNDLAS
jgi:histidine triad (HIT) family protein